MKEKRLLIVACMVLSLMAGYVGGAAAAPSSLPPVLMFTTHAMGTKYYALASGLGKVLSTHLKTEVKVMPTTGPGEWMPMIRSGEIDLGIANDWDSQHGFLAKGPYEKPLQGKGSRVRLLTSGAPNMMSVLVSETSGIKKYQDIKGKRFIGHYTGSAGQTAQALAALANFGLTEKDVKMVSVPGVGPAIRALIEGRADASGTGALGMGLVAELDASKGARFISYDTSPEAIKRFQAVYPAKPVRVEPGPGKIGVKEPTTMVEYDTYMLSRANLPEDAAYELVKVLWEYNKELWPIHVGLKSWTTDKFVIEKPLVPYHPGAIKFYKEKGVWNAKMDEIQKNLLAMEK